MSENLSTNHDDKRAAADSTTDLGARGEAMAAEYLLKQGYRIVVTNFKVPVGRNSKGISVTGEIDIIAIDDNTLVFVEVKTRRSDVFTPVITAVDRKKQRQITRTARVYRRIFAVRDSAHRYDVVTVLIPKNGDPTIELIKNFWSESKFRKRNWNNNAWYDFV